jgi:hypothetical protein
MENYDYNDLEKMILQYGVKDVLESIGYIIERIFTKAEKGE